MRLIDADNTLKAFAAEYRKTKELIDSGESHLDNLAEGFTEAAHIVKYIATTVDAVPVVRCKSCKYNRGSKKCLNPDSFFAVPKDDDFCSYGERKEGGAE
jgi:hypothetical protein